MSEKKRFAELSIEEFLERLGSGDPTPGGGAAAALESALGAALLMMVTNHTIGKPKYSGFEELNIRVRDEASLLRARLLQGMDNDAEAFGKVSAAYSLPRSSSDSCAEDLLKAQRTEAIASASIEAARAPLSVMEDSVKGIRLAADLIGKSNTNLASDIFVAALCFSAGLKAAAYNVKANLPAIEKKDPDLALKLQRRSEELLSEADALLPAILG